MRVVPKATFNRSSTLTTIRSANDKALTDLGNRAIKDTDQYVPESSDPHLINSSHTNSDMHAQNGKFRLRWSEPYARYLWHGKIMHGSPKTRTLNDYYGSIKFTKEMAKMEWAKYAAKVHKDDWHTVYQASLKERLKD